MHCQAGTSRLFKEEFMQPIISDISAAESGNAASDPGVSGVEELEPGPSSSKKSKGTFKYASSFLNPLELSIDITEESNALEGSDDDETYYPSFNISIGPRDVTGIEDCPCEEAVFPREDDDEEEVDNEEAEIGPSICRVLCPDDFDQLLDSHTALVYLQQLKALAMKKVDPLCKIKGCGGVLDIGIKHIGSAVYLKWICPNSHVAETWCSQPVLNRGLHSGDLLISSAILFSGNNFNKIELFAKILHMGFPSQSSFTKLQRKYLVPAVDDLWEEKQGEMTAEMADKDLVLLGDGKMDSPGLCAQYCTYTFMENDSKKIISAGQDKNCRELLKWSKDIVNHFWYTCKIANDLDEFMGIWAGVLHHVVGEHEWFLPYSDAGPSSCRHNPISEDTMRDKEWMKKGSPPHEALRKIVLDKRFLHNIPYYLNFRSTAELESYHNHMLMYSSKRYAYTPPVYRARSILAALDYNENVNREPIMNRDGTIRLQRTYNKKSGRWSVYPVKERKKYDHVSILLQKVLEKQIADREGFHGQLKLEEDDQRRISKTIAPIIPPPSIQLAEEKKSRFEN
uniref:Uncharacterized protein n=1 Tax=Magallana gigas TaxID=29159 RepID=A0A8W8M4P9_MAGGI